MNDEPVNKPADTMDPVTPQRDDCPDCKQNPCICLNKQKNTKEEESDIVTRTKPPDIRWV